MLLDAVAELISIKFSATTAQKKISARPFRIYALAGILLGYSARRTFQKASRTPRFSALCSVASFSKHSTVEARKSEHHYLHALEGKQKESQH